MKHVTRGPIAFGLFFGLLAATASAEQAQPDQSVPADAKIRVERFRMNPYHANIGKIASVKVDGTVQVVEVANPKFALTRRLAGQVDLTEGYYLGFVAREFVLSTKDTRLVRIQVTEVGAKGSATIRVSAAAAAKIKSGEQIVFFRPPGSTTAELKAAPDFALVDDGSETAVLGKNAVNAAAKLTTSQNNLKHVGLAMHNFHEVHGKLPPAVVYGPDGKPWHSWRVIILPFIDQAALYNQYRFDEPWNGPNNEKLLSKIPDIYHDPIYGRPDDYYTHYAAVTGDGTAFPTDGIKMSDSQPMSPLFNLTEGKGANSFRKFSDGMSNTILVGSVSPDRKIPWMKPEDVTFGDKFPALGEQGGFVAPYETGGVSATVFLFGDGAVRTIRSDINRTTLQNLMTIADGNPIEELPGIQRPRRRPGIKQVQVIEIVRTGTVVRARLVSKPID